jgi:hypothetical protein
VSSVAPDTRERLGSVVGNTFTNDVPMLLIGGLVSLALYVGWLVLRGGGRLVRPS